MIAKYNRRSIILAIPALIIQSAGAFLANEMTIPIWQLAGFIIAALGLIMFAVALCYYAMAKKRHPVWGLMGLFWFIGFAALAALKDKSVKMIPIYCQTCGYNLQGNTSNRCPECGNEITKLS